MIFGTIKQNAGINVSFAKHKRLLENPNFSGLIRGVYVFAFGNPRYECGTCE